MAAQEPAAAARGRSRKDAKAAGSNVLRAKQDAVARGLVTAQGGARLRLSAGQRGYRMVLDT